MVTCECEYGHPNICFIGNVEPQSSAVLAALREASPIPVYAFSNHPIPTYCWHAELIVVAGWRHLVPPEILSRARLGTIGFHSAKLPEYPGRAPVPWTFLRGDEFAYNTMLYLDEGVDSGDIIAERRLRLVDSDTPQTVYEWMAQSGVAMLRQHLTALLAGTAPRTPQNTAQRGPLTTKDGWDHYYLARQADGFG
jgi:methionyl-tRNA formyltransferase